DGFRLPNGYSVIFAYNASFASLFNAAVGGFPVDTKDGNIIGCPDTDRVLHLGVSELGSVEAPIFHFTTTNNVPKVIFDFLGGAPGGIVPVDGCVGISKLTTCE